MKRTLRLFLLLFCLVSCGEESKKKELFDSRFLELLRLNETEAGECYSDSAIVVDLNNLIGKEVVVSELYSDFKLVKLETTEESVIGNIKQILVTDEYIYICDEVSDKGLVIFDRSGKFVKRIRNANGPADIYDLNCISYDEECEELVVKQAVSVSAYDKRGEFKYYYPVSFMNNEMVAYQGKFIYLQKGEINNHLGAYLHHGLLVTDRYSRLEMAALPDSKCVGYMGYGYLDVQVVNDGVWLARPLNDTICKYDGSKVYAEYVLKYGPKVDFSEVDVADCRLFNNHVKENYGYFFVGDYLENESSQYVRIVSYNPGRDIIAYRDKKTGLLMGGTIVARYADWYPRYVPPMSVYKDCFVSYIPSDWVASEQQNSKKLKEEYKQILCSTTEDDNPIIVLYKIRSNEVEK